MLVADEERPLAELVPSAHIHGRLAISIDDHALPRLGYWNESDVCIGQWLAVLVHAVRQLGSGDGTYVYDEGEQGQPAYVFRRVGAALLVSVSESRLSGAPGSPDWVERPCELAAFAAATHTFLADLRAYLNEAAPAAAEVWCERWLANDPGELKPA